MKNKGDLTLSERLEIKILLDKGYSMRATSRVLGRGHNTVSYEIKNNMVNGVYDPHKAHHKSYVRKKYSRYEWKKINENKEIKAFIIECLKKHWNPDEISGYMKKNTTFYASKTAIYEWLYSTQGIPYCKYLYSQRYTKKKRVLKTKRVMIPNRVGIERRSKNIEYRKEYGHLEADTVVSGKRGSGALLVSVDRKSRYVCIKKLLSLKPQETVDTLRMVMNSYKVKSITFDNGIENRYHKQLNIPTFFCDPYSSWQKGSVENVNKMIRRYMPKGTNISSVSVEYIRYIQDLINKKPRKVLGYRSAYDVMMEKGLIKSEGVLIEG